MDFDLSADQRALQEGARDLLDGYSDPAKVRAHLTSGEPFDATIWSAMAEQGWCAVAVPEAEGGLGLGWVETAVLLGEIGRHTTPVPFAPTVLAAAALTGRPEHAERLAALIDGSSVGAVAWTADPDAIEVAAGNADGVVLTGRLGPVEAASVADVVVVVTPEDVFLVDLGATGRPVAEPAMDLTRSLSWLDLDMTPAIRLGGPEEAAWLGALGAVATSAELLGSADRVLELATEYAKDRVQFGAPIGSFQAVKHRCADMLVDVEGMRSVTWYAAWAVSTRAASSGDGWALAASTAKIWCADASKRVMGSGLQVHGGIGFTWEHDLHLFMKRSQFAQLAFGDAAHHRRLVAAELRAKVASGSGVM
jgi:alkylation response protein AidB-like acyl-CoA dehydrogenase